MKLLHGQLSQSLEKLKRSHRFLFIGENSIDYQAKLPHPLITI